jgi:OFA family oxalate/formate antiporter-like MFS transporter
LMLFIDSALLAFTAAGLFGIGIGGVLCILPIVWADYFGRKSFGSIRGIVLTIQVAAQALGPILSGLLRDWSNSYDLSLLLFAGMSFTAAIIGLITIPPVSIKMTKRDPAECK